MQQDKQLFRKVNSFVRHHKWTAGAVAVAILASGGYLAARLVAGSAPTVPQVIKPKENEKQKVEVKAEDTRVRAPLSGVLTTKGLARRKPLAVVIENHPDARPQSGLNQASLVYETFAEGGITRFLALFQENEPKEIGPVRSARTYFTDWAYSYKALFAHVGGNQDALDLIPQLNVLDINEFSSGDYFWRDRSRYAPHNVYTTVSKLMQAAQAKGYAVDDSSVASFVFKDDGKEAARPSDYLLKVNFNHDYAVTWAYSKKDNLFYRSIKGTKQTDRVTGEQIKAKNLLVAFTSFAYGTTRIGEQTVMVTTVGSGDGVAFVDGVRTPCTWKRFNREEPVRFFDKNGQEIKLNAGTTWIEYAPAGTEVK